MSTRDPIPYVGRFAPSPTGPLHFGSLVAAVASYLQARANNGRWLLRIEDIDPPREQPGATNVIIEALQRFGFEWDGDIIYQSTSDAAHRSALAALLDRGLAYRCRCSRRDLADAPTGPLGRIYPGTCRNGCEVGEAAIRIRTNDDEIAFQDALQGRISQQLESESGDFVIRRRDGLTAYHLAVVVDDEIQGVTEIVRGIDLMDSTPRQIWLQRLLGFETPNYLHIPVAVNALEQKLSKSHGAAGIPQSNVANTLHAALTTLGQKPPLELANSPVKGIWAWAVENWNIAVLSKQTQLPVAKNLYQVSKTKSDEKPLTSGP